LSAATAGIAARQPAAVDDRPCLLVNPNSFRTLRGALAERAAQLAHARGAEVERVADPASVAAALDRALARGQPALFVLAGDGTVQAIVEHLARLPDAVPLPPLLVLGGGRTNMTAADLRGRGSVLRKLDAALLAWRAGRALQTEQRQTLQVAQPPAPARHGFFLAAGLVDRVIRACHARRAGQSHGLRTGHAATAFSVLTLAFGALRRRRPPSELRVAVPGYPALDAPARLLIATTLQRRHGLLDPYARRGQGELRFTAIAARGPGFWARLPAVATGGFTKRMSAEHGYLSGRGERVEVLGAASYTLDGEEFDADPSRALVITPGRRLQFLTP
jgi:diacylglycerol kinase family enzyme